MIKKILFIFAAVVVTAGLVSAQENADDKEVTGADDLVKKTSSQFQELWINPDAEISNYHKLYVWKPVFQFRDLGDQSANRTSIAMARNQGHFAVPEEDQKKFEKLVTDVLLEGIERSKQFEIVDSIGSGTLIVRAEILDIVSNVPPNVGRLANVHLSSMGEATFVWELIDAETGVIQARSADRRYIQPPAAMNTVNAAPTNASTAWNYVELWANDQALTLRRVLDKAAKKAKKK